MSEKKINLEELLDSFGIEDESTNPNQDLRDSYQRHKSILLEFGKQLLKLAAKNAKFCIDSRSTYTHIDKQSILDTIKQIK